MNGAPRRSEDLAGASAFEIKGQGPEEHEDDPSAHDQRIDGQEDDVDDRPPPGGIEREEEVGRGFAFLSKGELR